MSSKSNIYSCVPGCTQKGTVDPEGNRVGFFGLPNDGCMGCQKTNFPCFSNSLNQDVKQIQPLFSKIYFLQVLAIGN